MRTNYPILGFTCFAVCALLLFPSIVFAQIILINEMPRGIYYERTARVTKFKDMENFRDVFHYDKFLLGDNIISGNISYNTGRIIVDNNGDRHKEMRSALAFFTKVRIVEEFCFTTTFFKDFNKAANPRWVADYTYTLARYSWKPKTFSYGYENYNPNKYGDSASEMWRKFLRGYYFGSYTYPLPTGWKALDNILKIDLSAYARYSIKYLDEFEREQGSLINGKPTFGLSLRYAFIKVINRWYFEFTPQIYLNQKYKQPWDPDYTYGFGYFDWRSFRISFTYGNYSINRYPWNKQLYPEHNFWDGNFKIIANYIW